MSDKTDHEVNALPNPDQRCRLVCDCGARLTAKAKTIGRKLPCPQCNKLIDIRLDMFAPDRTADTHQQTASNPRKPDTASPPELPPRAPEKNPDMGPADETVAEAVAEPPVTVEPAAVDPTWYGTWFVSSDGFKIDDVRKAMSVCLGSAHSVVPVAANHEFGVEPRALDRSELGQALSSGFAYLVARLFSMMYLILGVAIGVLFLSFVIDIMAEALGSVFQLILEISVAVAFLLFMIGLILEFLWGIWMVIAGAIAFVRGRPFVFRAWEESEKRHKGDAVVQFTRRELPQTLRLDLRRSFARKVSDLIKKADHDQRIDAIGWLTHLAVRMVRLPFLIGSFFLQLLVGGRGDEFSIFLFITGGELNLKGAWLLDRPLRDTVSDVAKSTQRPFHYVTVMPGQADAMQQAIESSLGISVKVLGEESAIELLAKW